MPRTVMARTVKKTTATCGLKVFAVAAVIACIVMSLDQNRGSEMVRDLSGIALKTFATAESGLKANETHSALSANALTTLEETSQDLHNLQSRESDTTLVGESDSDRQRDATDGSQQVIPNSATLGKEKNSKYAPIVADEAKLDKWLQDYYDYHKRVLQDHSLDKVSRKFLVFQTMQVGVGNTLVALVSCFLFAIMTERIFLIDWNDVREIKQKGCGGRGGGTVDRCISDYKDNIDSLLDAPGGINWNYEQVIKKLGFTQDEVKRHRIHVEKTPNSRGILEALQCDDYAETFPHQFVFFRSNTYWVTNAYHNPNYYHKLLPMLGTEPFSLLARRMILFKPFVQKLLDAAPVLPKPAVCAHVRIATMRWESSNQKKAFTQHLDCMDNLVEQHRAKSVYIAMMPSLRKKYEQTIRSHYESKKLSILFHDASTGNPLVDDLVELLRMLPCDEIVASHSTISQVVLALRHEKSVVPHIIQGSPPKACSKQSTAEPCATMWVQLTRSRLKCSAKVSASLETVDSEHGCWPYDRTDLGRGEVFGPRSYSHRVLDAMKKLDQGSSPGPTIKELWKKFDSEERQRFAKTFPEFAREVGS